MTQDTDHKPNNSLARRSDVSLDRTPPQNIELEMCVLGGIMLDPKHAYQIAAEYLTRESFYLDGHGLVFEVMGKLHGHGIPPDCDMLMDELRATDKLDQVGGAAVILSMLNSVPSAASVEYHAKKIREKAYLRALIRAYTQGIEECYLQDLSLEEIIAQAETLVMQMSADVVDTSALEHIAATAVEQWEGMAARHDERIRRLRAGEQNKDIVLRPGIPTGYTDLDKILGNMRRSEMIVIGARPSKGKTALGLNIAHNIAIARQRPVPTAIFSLEMSKEQLVERLKSMGTKYWLDNRIRGVNTGQMRDANLNKHEWNVLTQAYNKILQAPIYIDDTSDLTITALQSKCRRAVQQHGIECIIVDYLQLLNGHPGQRYNNSNEKFTAISRGLKAIARELDLPVVVMSQLKRPTDQRRDKKPGLADLRESGAIEQDADVVMFIHREPDPQNAVCCNQRRIDEYGCCPECGAMQLFDAEILVKKNRNFTTGDCKLRWSKTITKFFGWDGH